jgi:PPP family 3-phenylpropionic acid transporter
MSPIQKPDHPMDASPTQLARRNLSLTRLYYLLFFGGNGFLLPFQSLFFVHIGLSGTQIGWVTSLASFVTLLAAPFWAQRNASWHNPRTAMQAFVVLTSLCHLWMSQQVMFWGVALVMLLRALVGAGIMPLSDSLAVSVTTVARAGFGSVRVFGSLGWIIFLMIAGFVVQNAGLQSSLIGAGLIAGTGALVLMPIEVNDFRSHRPQNPSAGGFRVLLKNMLHNPPLLGIAGMLILTFLANSGVSQFDSVFMRQLGASDPEIALAGIVGAIIELPAMFWADRMARRYGPYRILVTAVLVSGLLRGLIFVVPTFPTILLVRFLFGLPFSFYTVALIQAIVQHSAEHEKHTALALLTVTLPSLMGIIGAPIAGAAFDHLGARWLYAIYAGGYVLAWLVLRLMAPSQDGEPEVNVI